MSSKLVPVIFGFCILALPTLSFSAYEPDQVAAEVQSAVRICREMGGNPQPDAMLRVDDLNGDGAEDWIVDYLKFKCSGVTNPFCGSGGCSLQIFLWEREAKWRLAFDEVLHGYKIMVTNGQRVLQLRFGGAVCNRANSTRCVKNYRINRTRIDAID